MALCKSARLFANTALWKAINNAGHEHGSMLRSSNDTPDTQGGK